MKARESKMGKCTYRLELQFPASKSGICARMAFLAHLYILSPFLLEPLTAFQERYDWMFADVWNRKILNCNFTFAIGRSNWVIHQTCANYTKCCWLLDAGAGDVLPNTRGSKLDSVICGFAFVHFSLFLYLLESSTLMSVSVLLSWLHSVFLEQDINLSRTSQLNKG